MKRSDIHLSDSNPRYIRDPRFEKLKQSIEEFPKMLKLRPIVIDSDGKVLGGNMRLRAMDALGWKEIPDDYVKRADELTEEEKKRFVIADNVGFGDWDWDVLANEWDQDELEEWGLELPVDWGEDEDEIPPSTDMTELDELYKPYSVINRREGAWMERSSQLKKLCGEEIGRKADNQKADLARMAQKSKSWSGNDTGISIFDPCLCEWAIHQFKPKTILDPFAGGPSRAVASINMGVKYVGYDISETQIKHNEKVINSELIEYRIGSYDEQDDKSMYDMVFTCPPYWKMEQYSKDDKDLSNMDFDAFNTKYRQIIASSVESLNTGGHCVIVIGNLRDKGKYFDLETLTKEIYNDVGLNIIGDCIIIDPIGAKTMIGGPHLKRYGLITRAHQYLIVGRKDKALQDSRGE